MFTPCCDNSVRTPDREGNHDWTCPKCGQNYSANTTKWLKVADNQGEIKARTHRFHKV